MKGRANRGPLRSAAKAQALDELLVLLRFGCLEIVEELAALVDELDLAAARGMIALMRREMLAETVDALGKERDLDLGGAGVGGPAPELREDAALFLTT
jgi:hypothetical protein